MSKLTINIDMDGVIYDMMSELARLADTKTAQQLFDFDGTNRTITPDTWDISKAWGMKSKSQFWKFFYEAVGQGLFLNGQPIDGAIETIGQFVKKGHRVRIVTSKMFSDTMVARQSQIDVIEWLSNVAPDWSYKVETCFTSNKQGYEADVIIDDKPTLAWAQEGKINVLFDHTWNQEINANPVGVFPMEPQLYRARGWDQVAYLVARASA